MSLHIGNLSSRIRPDELERVFRRFGRCTINIKNKYGFVVYDYPASAERALKTLKGNRICGEAINLSWSKQQPTAAPKRFSMDGKKLHDHLPRRGYAVSDNADRRPGTTDQHVDSKKLDGEVRQRLGSSVFVNDSNGNIPFDLNTCMTMSDRKELLQADLNVQSVGNGTGFDRYEPHDEGKKEDQMFEKKAQCDKEMSASRKRQSSTDRGDSSKKTNKRDYSEGEKGLSPFSVNSDCASSRSQSSSRSLMSLFESLSHSESKSVDMEKVSRSSSRRSSPSCHSGTKTFDSRSRSNSRNSYLLPLENDSKNCVGDDVGVVCSNDLKISGNITSAVENGLETRPAKLGLEEDTEKDISKTDEDFVGENISAADVKSENLTPAVENELETRPAKLGQEGDAEKDILKTDEDFAGEGEHVSAAVSDIPVRSKISSEEMCMVLKHCGLQCPDEKEIDLTVETFLGSARMWPWELVYYRRLKKGAILAENYSRRVAQNQEFGIVDKYIRGSSGWGELS